MMLMVSGALWLRFNILKDTRSDSSGSVAAGPLVKIKEWNDLGNGNEKSAETFFYVGNLYPFFYSHELQNY